MFMNKCTGKKNFNEFFDDLLYFLEMLNKNCEILPFSNIFPEYSTSNAFDAMDFCEKKKTNENGKNKLRINVMHST